MYIGHARICLSVCLSAAACPVAHTTACTDSESDVTWGVIGGAPLVMHYWADVQSVHEFRCYEPMTTRRTRNLSECLYIPLYSGCGFWSVAVNRVYKFQIFKNNYWLLWSLVFFFLFIVFIKTLISYTSQWRSARCWECCRVFVLLYKGVLILEALIFQGTKSQKFDTGPSNNDLACSQIKIE